MKTISRPTSKPDLESIHKIKAFHSAAHDLYGGGKFKGKINQRKKKKKKS